MAAKKAKKTTKKTAKKAPAKKVAGKRSPPLTLPAPVVTGGDAPQAALAVAPPPPPTTDQDFLSKTGALDALANEMNSEGHKVIVRGDEAPNPYIIRRPTGITELDIHLAGGWPAGGTCFVSGPDNCGKTWLMMQTMAMQQKIHGATCVQAMGISEGGFPYDQAIRVGLRIAVPDEMILQWQSWREQRGMPGYSTPDIAYFKEQVGDFRILRGSTGEELLTALLKVIATRACSVVCVDSLQGLQPSVDAMKNMTDAEKQAAHATMIGRFFKKYIPLTTGISGVNETTLLMTQQVRANRAKSEASSNIQKYLKDWAVTGSRAAMHFKLVDLLLYDGKLLKKGDQETGKETIGKVLKWEFEKGKAGTHDNLTGEVQYRYKNNDGTDFPPGVDFTGTVMDSGMQRGVIRKVGKHITLVRPETNQVLDDYSAPSQKAFRRCMDEDFDFELSVRLEILAAAGVQCLYR